MKPTALERFAAFIVNTPVGRHPNAALVRARFAVLDTLGCVLLGAHSEVASVARNATAAWGQGDSQVLGTREALAQPWAALVNGAAGHALDLDDYTFIANDHPSSVMLPALLAAAEPQQSELSGLDLLDAYLIGLEVIFKLGEAVNMGHYNLGWHTTSTLDSLGATAALCRLKRLPKYKLRRPYH